MLSSNLTLKGHVTVSLNGEVVRDIPNLVVTTGKNFVASAMASNSTNLMSHMAVGTSDIAAAATDTALGAETGRAAITSGTATDNTVTYLASFTEGTGSGALTEAALFNDSSAGDMLCRTVFNVVNKGANDSMLLRWVITVA